MDGRAGSARLEPGRAPGKAGAHALTGVGGLDQPGLLLLLALGGRPHPLGQSHPQRLSQRHHRQRRGGGNLAGHRPGRVAHLILLHQPVGQADGNGLVALDATAGVEQPLRPLRTDQRRVTRQGI